jgi:single-strand DNA-binding protein
MNKIMLIGHLGKDAELTYTPNGAAVAKFSLATSRRYTDKASGERKSDTTWFNIVAWEKLAETCSTYLKKGAKVFVEGRMVTREYTDKDNIKRTAWDVVISEMEMLDNKPANGTAAATPAGTGEEFPF